jgi:hypothetical protein
VFIVLPTTRRAATAPRQRDRGLRAREAPEHILVVAVTLARLIGLDRLGNGCEPFLLVPLCAFGIGCGPVRLSPFAGWGRNVAAVGSVMVVHQLVVLRQQLVASMQGAPRHRGHQDGRHRR